MELITEPGWSGHFTRNQELGAIRNGVRVVKQNSEPGDAHANGTLGTILGSVGNQEIGIAYFVEWDPSPKVAVGTMAKKVEVWLNG